MAEGFVFPDRLETHAVDDARMAEAYESLGAVSRSALKKCIARLYRIWGESPERAVSLTCPGPDFCLEREEGPADAAVIVCEAGYPHPAAFLAALMPAVLSGARLVLPLFLSSAASAPADTRTPALPSPPLLAALELAGVEKAWCLDEDAILDVVRELPQDAGRLLLLGEKPFGERLVLHAHNTGLACRSFVLPLQHHAVRLDAAHENMWIWPDLEPGWFRLRRVRLYSPETTG